MPVLLDEGLLLPPLLTLLIGLLSLLSQEIIHWGLGSRMLVGVYQLETGAESLSVLTSGAARPVLSRHTAPPPLREQTQHPT